MSNPMSFPSSVLVTGGAGFLGRALVQQLLDRGGVDIAVLAMPQENVPPHWGVRVRVCRRHRTRPAASRAPRRRRSHEAGRARA